MRGGRYRAQWTIICAPLIWVALGNSSAFTHPRLKQSNHDKKNIVILKNGDWLLTIHRDDFRASISCGLRSRDTRALYVSNAVGFRLSHHSDVAHAAFRIDNGAAHIWRDQLPELARLGVSIDGRDMDTPTDGIVWLPLAAIVKANIITIQKRPQSSPQKFSLNGFAELLEAAREKGCVNQGRFVR